MTMPTFEPQQQPTMMDMLRAMTPEQKQMLWSLMGNYPQGQLSELRNPFEGHPFTYRPPSPLPVPPPATIADLLRKGGQMFNSAALGPGTGMADWLAQVGPRDWHVLGNSDPGIFGGGTPQSGDPIVNRLMPVPADPRLPRRPYQSSDSYQPSGDPIWP
jgi:hypothetical protein